MDSRKSDGNLFAVVATLMVLSIVANLFLIVANRDAASRATEGAKVQRETLDILSQTRSDMYDLQQNNNALRDELSDAKRQLAESKPTSPAETKQAAPVSTNVPTKPATSDVKSPGPCLRFKDQPSQDVPVWTTKPAFEEGAKHFARDDLYGLADQTLAGLFSDVPPGTSCKLLEAGLGWVKVRVLTGELAGVAVYTFAEAYND